MGSEHDYGRNVGPFWWRYDLSAGRRFLTAHGWELRWWGVTIGEVGIGVMVRRPASSPTGREPRRMQREAEARVRRQERKP
ncbi:MAG TPA: hypothetical protein VFI96_01720 [Longimicrobiaceae bacterium]|nr:hypothetical protein [Longimicrobiaceae bacterium]